jgi:hypothetical protein
MPPRRTLVAASTLAAFLFAGSAAGAVSIPGAGQPSRDLADLRERLRTQFQSSFAGLKLPGTELGTPAVPATTTAAPSVDPFPGLAAGQFAAYASATVNHTGAPLAVKEARRDLNLATSHAAHTGSALPGWDSEIGRRAFPALAAGSSQAKAWAAEIGNPDDNEDNSDAPLEPAVASAPPTASPVVEDTLPINAPPLLKDKALRAEASARALRTGCVIGSDLALGRAEANDTNVGEITGDPKSPKPILSLDGDTPPRAISQSLARTRLVPIEGQPNHFGVIAETRETIAPVTFFKGDKQRELTIEVAGEWVLRATANGTIGSVTLGVENAPEDLPLLRVIRRDESGKTTVTSILSLDELSDLNGGGGIDLGNGLELIIGETPRQLRGATGTPPMATGTRAVGALDILRLQVSDDPDDALARIGHMEAGVAVPPGGVACPGIAVSKKSSQPNVDAGSRFNWLIDVSNPNDCVLDKVQLVDTTQPSRGLVYRVISTSPQAKVDGNTVTFAGIGPIPPGGKQSLRIDIEVDPASAGGRFTNLAVANGACGSAAITGAAGDSTEVEQSPPLGLVGQGGAEEPAVLIRPSRTAKGAAGPGPFGGVVVRPGPVPSTEIGGSSALTRSASEAPPETPRAPQGTLAATGGATSALLGVALLGVGIALRRFRLRSLARR